MLSSLIAVTKEWVCVAEDAAVACYSSKTLRKLRVERLSDYRVVGMMAVGGANAAEEALYVVDASGSCFVVHLEHFTVSRSFSVVAEETSASLPVVSTRLSRGAAKTTPGATTVLSAGFAYAPEDSLDGSISRGELRAVYLTATGVYDISAGTAGSSSAPPRLLIKLPTGLSHCLLAVGLRSGIVAVGQKGQRWLTVARIIPAPQTTHQQSAGGGSVALPTTQLALSLDLCSLAASPVYPSVAAGGVRGELAVFPDALADRHHFSEHWHHTPLAAVTFSIDGASLFTGAGESVLLVWNMQTFTFRKVGCSSGAIRGIAANVHAPSQLVLPCGESSLVSLDLLNRKATASIDGVQWSSAQACTGLVVTQWMGRTGVVLTGLPDVVRVCDPATRQAVHSLHISHQMETLSDPPRVGIDHVAIFDEGRTVVTYESFSSLALPSVLRFWVFDAAAKRHVEVQTVYSPHDSNHGGEVIAMVADEKHRRVFTLSRDAIKCWGEKEVDSSDVTRELVGGAAPETKKRWSNIGAMPTPSRRVASMCLSEDGSVCAVADDCVHVYGVLSMKAGVQWPLIGALVQHETTDALTDLSLQQQERTLTAHTNRHVFSWSLVDGSYTTWEPSAATATSPGGQKEDEAPSSGIGITSGCSFVSAAYLVACTDGTIREIGKDGVQRSVTTVGKGATGGDAVLHIRVLNASQRRVALVEAEKGFRVVTIAAASPSTASAKTGAASAAEAAGAAADVEFEANPVDVAYTAAQSSAQQHQALRGFFRGAAPTAPQDDSPEDIAGGGVGGRLSRAEIALNAARAREHLQLLVGKEAFTAPPMSSVLSAYLAKSQGSHHR